jgi:hypothetical protein
MSVTTFIGLAITIGLLSGVVCALIVLVFASRRRWSMELCARRTDAYARWLAARLNLTRASLSFVSAFRTLAAESRESTYFALRCEEAQRARAAWCDAVRELDLAEASLVAWVDDPTLPQQLGQLGRIEAAALRRAIHGEEQEVDELTDEFHKKDRQAAEFASKAAARLLSRRPGWRALLDRMMWHLDEMITGRTGTSHH